LFEKTEDTKREALDVRLSDFDDVSYRVTVEKDTTNIMKVQMSLPCFHQFKDLGGDEAIQRHYAGLTVDPDSGFDVAVSVDCDNLPSGVKPEQMIERLGLMKANILGGIFEYYLGNLLKGGKAPASKKFDLRSDTAIYFVPAADRVTIIYSIDFKERVDKAVARVFLQEFVDARRALGAAPPVSFGTNPPLELKEFGVTEPTGNLGFVSFSVLKSHVDRDKKDKVIAVLQSFRNFLQYHIKCSKSYFHSRMRARVVSLLMVLNRAKHDPIGDNEKGKKTITGKTFTRAA
jgi:actin related protein 2/3 complex subunit 2